MQVSVTNPEKWKHEDRIKIGQCTKCRTYHSFGWLFNGMTWVRNYCWKCSEFRKFIVKPELKLKP